MSLSALQRITSYVLQSLLSFEPHYVNEPYRMFHVEQRTHYTPSLLNLSSPALALAPALLVFIPWSHANVREQTFLLLMSSCVRTLAHVNPPISLLSFDLTKIQTFSTFPNNFRYLYSF